MTLFTLEQLKQWYRDHFNETLRDFFTFLSFPSISTDPHYAPDARRAAEWLCNYMKQIGLETSLWETPGLPVVFGTHLKAGDQRPTLLLYHHYDVQPVDPIELWQSDPFKPEIRNNQVYARGAVDNKGQCFYTLTALKAALELAGQLNINIKVFIEGEEESGGRGTAAILKERGEQLRADYLLVIDFDMPGLSSPGITLGMRGLTALDVAVSNAAADLHSGIHGGIALNPNRALATLLAGMWDQKGCVQIPHFYEGVSPLSEKDRSHLDMTFDVEQYRKSFGVSSFCMEEGYAIKESNWLRPTLEINGMWGGYSGPGCKTVIPAKAFAKISCRLVPEQDPVKVAEAVAQYFTSSAPAGIHVEVDIHHGAPAYRSDFNTSIVKTVAASYEEVFGVPCQYLLCGASVPIVVDLAQASQAQVAMMGVGLSDDAIHAPNEHFGLDRFELGFLVIGRILNTLHSSA